MKNGLVWSSALYKQFNGKRHRNYHIDVTLNWLHYCDDMTYISGESVTLNAIWTDRCVAAIGEFREPSGRSRTFVHGRPLAWAVPSWWWCFPSSEAVRQRDTPLWGQLNWWRSVEQTVQLLGDANSSTTIFFLTKISYRNYTPALSHKSMVLVLPFFYSLSKEEILHIIFAVTCSITTFHNTTHSNWVV